eukprot:9860325-Prorocentrum_lima.AAC.1
MPPKTSSDHVHQLHPIVAKLHCDVRGDIRHSGAALRKRVCLLFPCPDTWPLPRRGMSGVQIQPLELVPA